METITIQPNGRVYLNLPNNSYKPNRQIGFIRNSIFNTVRTTKQVLRINNSLGFSFRLMKECNKFNLVCVEYVMLQMEMDKGIS